MRTSGTARLERPATWILCWGAALAALGLWACATTRGKGEAGAPAARVSDLIFSHARHGEQGVECKTCHKGIDDADALGRHLPAMKDCAECHETRDQRTCRLCHRDTAHPGKGGRPSTPGLIFSHKRHLQGRVKDCVTCHTGAAVTTSVQQIARPKMRGDCFTCHQHLDQYRKLRCGVCHQSLGHYPIKYVAQFNHEGNFLREHGRYARTAGGDTCAACHSQSYCAECHAGQRAGVLPSVKLAERSDRRFIHQGDWINRHPIESRASPQSCSRCHSPKSCDTCHQASGVSASAVGGGGKRSPHPVDWLNPGSPNSHGGEARRRITQCAGCHDQGALSNCVRCHKSTAKGGLGIKPHPPGWKRGGKGSAPVCLTCH